MQFGKVMVSDLDWRFHHTSFNPISEEFFEFYWDGRNSYQVLNNGAVVYEGNNLSIVNEF